MKKRVKVVITGYYEVDMSRAKEFYRTTDPDEMLAVDEKNIKNYPEEMLDALGEFQVDLSWEN